MNSKIDIAKQPLVSIITPHKNRIKYLDECIQSVLDQSYPHIEHIIIDGGSSDGTVALLEKYRSFYPDRLRFISEHDEGAGEAWNKGLKLARGEILGLLCSDDMLYGRNAIRAVAQFFLSNPDAKFVHGSCNYVSGTGELLYTRKAKYFTIEELLNADNPIACPSAFYRREIVETVGLPDDYGNDYDYMIRIAKRFRIYCIDDVLSNFRVHSESETGNLEQYVKVVKKDYLVMRQHGGSIFSKRAKRYYMFTILKKLGLLSLVPFVRRLKRMTKKH